jgi:uncharacterized protein with PQ loop repeat
MPLEDITLAIFAACNSVRVVAYLPQIHKAATDKNGASSISFITWSLFLVAHVSTVAYALINRSDWGLAACFAINAICCVAILAIAYGKRRSHTKRLTERPVAASAARCPECRPRANAPRRPARLRRIPPWP